ncbi:MAG TPA: Ni/Fe-hydrogenase cytochrome b subunit [Planctomycetota bacterium]
MATTLSISDSPATTSSLARFVLQEFSPKGKILTPFNVITMIIMLATAVILVVRFAFGLGAVTNLSQDYPWGIWKSFNVVSGVALAGGAYVITFMVYILRMEKYHAIVRVTVLNGFLAYCFYAGALLLELGRPWNVINPIIGNSFGFSSVLFLVSWHFMLYMMAQLVEFSPAIAEWLGLRRVHRILNILTIGAVIFGISLSTLHQSGLGALFLMAKGKIHPLWYSEMIPLLFLVSSVFAGLGMVIFEGSLSRRVFHDRLSPEHARSHDDIVIGLARIAGSVMFVYLFLVILNFIHGKHWQHFAGGWAVWFLVETVGLVTVPMILLLVGASKRRVGLIRVAAILTVLGVILNRLNISMITFRWYDPNHYVPTWMELVVTAGVISAEIWVFRWVVRRMPVLSQPPAWAATHAEPALDHAAPAPSAA